MDADVSVRLLCLLVGLIIGQWVMDGYWVSKAKTGYIRASAKGRLFIVKEDGFEVKHSLGIKEFRALVHGGQVTINRADFPVKLILKDIGFEAMEDAILDITMGVKSHKEESVEVWG